MRAYFLFLIPLLIFSCEGEVEENPDTDFEIIEEVDSTPVEIIEEEEWGNPYYDTLYYEDEASKFEQAQLNNQSLSVFWTPQLEVFSDPELTEVIAVLKNGDKVEFIEGTDEYAVNIGFHGEVVKIDVMGEIGYTNSAFLSRFPNPKTVNSIEDYCKNHLHLIESVQIEQRLLRNSEYDDDGEMSSTTKIFKYEGGIKVKTVHGWEYGDSRMYIPDITVSKAFLLMSALWSSGNELYKLTDGDFPTEGITILESEYEYEENQIIVETDRTGFPTRVKYIFGEGCSSWCEVFYEEEYTVINIGGGC